MYFSIQKSNPNFDLEGVSEDIETLGELLEEVCLLETEAAIVNWNGVSIPICYKYDLSVFIEEILCMVEKLLTNESGTFSDCWPSNTFLVEWELSWSGDGLDVAVNWKSLAGGLEVLAQERPQLKTTKNQFAAEWGELIDVVAKIIVESECSGINLSMFERAQRLLSEIPERGRLYRLELR